MAKRKKGKVRLHHFILPNPETHKKAHLISFKALVIYALFFILLQVTFKGISIVKPNVLGITSNMNQQDLIKLTNVERQKNGLPALTENSELDKAAAEKGKNMLTENYWAHYSPSGKSPWDFIKSSGYDFSYAGENLARNFYTSQDVVNACMASTMGHRENVLNSHYKEVGMAVVQGKLQGQDTILVVQEFGTQTNSLAAKPNIDNEGVNIAKVNDQNASKQSVVNIPVNATPQAGVESASTQASGFISLFDPYKTTKTLGFGLLSVLALLLLTDMFVIFVVRRKPLYHFATRHVPHVALWVVAFAILIHFGPGIIL